MKACILMSGFVFGLVACGGGTTTSTSPSADTNSPGNNVEESATVGGDNVAVSNTTNQLAQEENSVVAEENVMLSTTSELETSETFEIRSVSSLDVSINLVALVGKRAYVNICKTYDNGRTNYNDCIIRSPIENGQWGALLSIPHDVSNLKLEIWQYSEALEPQVYTWENTNIDTQWHIES